MKKIYWCVQQLNFKGGTEQVSIGLMNLLCDYYDISLVSTSEIKGDIVYDIDPRIKIESLNVPLKINKFDYYFTQYIKEKKIFRAFGLFFSLIKHTVFLRRRYRKRMTKITNGETVISSSLDSQWFSPKKGRFFIHFHFSAENYLNFGNKLSRLFIRKPEKTILLSKDIYDGIVKKRKKEKFAYIANPVRFDATKNLSNNGNKIVFVGRYAPQKDPMLALNVAKELKSLCVNFHLDFYGDGPLKEEMEKFVLDNSLNDVVTINKPTNKIEEVFISSDLLLMTSRFEGAPLVIGEAKAFSLPVVTTRYKGNVNLFKNGYDGFIIETRKEKDIANKLKDILSDEKALLTYKRNAYDSALSFDKSSIKEAWINLLK